MRKKGFKKVSNANINTNRICRNKKGFKLSLKKLENKAREWGRAGWRENRGRRDWVQRLKGDEEGKFWVGGKWDECDYLEEGTTLMHEEGIRKWPKQGEKMPDGWVTEMEEEIKSKETETVFFVGRWDISIVQNRELVPDMIKSSAKKKTLKHL